MKFNSTTVKRSFFFWIVMIGMGLVAYGLGRYQGSQHRSEQLQRSMASEPQP